MREEAVTPPSRQRRRTKDIPPDREGKGGNPGLLTTALADRLIGIVETGVPLDVAIAYVGIHRETLRRWRRRGDVALEIGASRRNPTERRYADFVQRIDSAIATTTVLAQATLKRLLIGPPPTIDNATGVRYSAPMTDAEKRIQADMVKFYLGRRERKHYGAAEKRDLNGSNSESALNAGMSSEEAWEAFMKIFGEFEGINDP